MKAPKKLYFGLQGDIGILDIYSKRESENDVEYVRKDAFIEKACKWLKEQDEMVGISFTEDFIARFQNYMNGE